MILETDRLILKTLNPSKASAVLDYYVKNQDFLREWEPAKGSAFYTKAYHKEALKQEMREMKKGNLMRFWIYRKNEPQLIIGTFCFSNIIRGPFMSCYLGYKLDREHLKKGYMTEALREGIQWMFHKEKLHRIEANIMPRNEASIKTVEKLGFVYEGISKSYLNINGAWEDHIHMVLLNNANLNE